MKLLMVATALLLAGCAEAGVEYNISGSFTTERTQEDLTAFGEKVAELGGEWVLMESWPEQYRATFPSLSACDSFHNWVRAQSFVNQETDSHCVKA